MTSPYDEFLNTANPHAWLLSADDLHRKADVIYRAYGQAKITRTEFSTGKRVALDHVVRPAFLLAGFSLENAIKAHLVFEFPHWISNGKLSSELRSHALVDLQRKSSLVPYRSRLIWVLRTFQDGLNSWARYPCALAAAETHAPFDLPPDLWFQYRRLMNAYGRRMMKLLRRGWNGPHGFHGRWTFSRDFLDMTAPTNRNPWSQSPL